MDIDKLDFIADGYRARDESDKALCAVPRFGENDLWGDPLLATFGSKKSGKFNGPWSFCLDDKSNLLLPIRRIEWLE